MPMMPMSDGVALHYRFDGDASLPVMMLSNSLGSTLDMWELQMPALAQHFRVLRYDNRGHGASDVPDGPYTIDRIARDAQELLEGLAAAPLAFCGLSCGGMVGMWLAIHAPGLLSRAVFANTSAYFGQPEPWNQRIAMVEAEGMHVAAGAIIQRWLTPEFIEREPAVTAKMLAMVAGIPPKGYCGGVAAVRDVDLRAGLPGIRMPVLVIAGAVDPATPPAMGEAIANAVPGAKLATLNAAHLPNIELAEDFNALLVAFLAQKQPDLARMQ